jgi:hypothetical protein
VQRPLLCPRVSTSRVGCAPDAPALTRAVHGIGQRGGGEEEEEEEYLESYTREAIPNEMGPTRCRATPGGGESFNQSEEVSPTRFRVAPAQSSPLEKTQRTVAIAPQAGTEAPTGLIKKDSTKARCGMQSHTGPKVYPKSGRHPTLEVLCDLRLFASRAGIHSNRRGHTV